MNQSSANQFQFILNIAIIDCLKEYFVIKLFNDLYIKLYVYKRTLQYRIKKLQNDNYFYIA